MQMITTDYQADSPAMHCLSHNRPGIDGGVPGGDDQDDDFEEDEGAEEESTTVQDKPTKDESSSDDTDEESEEEDLELADEGLLCFKKEWESQDDEKDPTSPTSA